MSFEDRGERLVARRKSIRSFGKTFFGETSGGHRLAWKSVLVHQRLGQEILKQDATVARFVWVLPARTALVPVLERFFQMELHCVN